MSIPSHMQTFLGKNQFERFLKKTVFPDLERLVEQGEADDQTLKHHLKLFWDKGPSGLDLTMHYLDAPSTTTIEDDGFLGYAKLDIGNGNFLTYFVKQASSKENFRTGLRVQQEMSEFVKGTDYEGRIPAVMYSDKKKRIMITPFLSDETLKGHLTTLNHDEKISRLKKSIDEYVGLYNLMNDPQIKQTPLVSKAKKIKNLVFSYFTKNHSSEKIIDFPVQLANFTTYFSHRYSSNTELVDLFDKQIGSFLNSKANKNIHGDLHGHNEVLVNDKENYIDWPSATRNGFLEFDMRKKLVKADLSFEDEVMAAEYVATKASKTKEGQEDSFKTYALNRIAQGLYASEKYFTAGNTIYGATRNDKFKGMAFILYTDTTRWMDLAVKKGFITQELVDKLHENAPLDIDYGRLRSTPDDWYNSHRETHNPYKLMSQENLDLPPDTRSKFNPKKQINKAKEQLTVNYWNRLAKKIAIPVVASLIGFATYTTIHSHNLSEEIKLANKRELVHEQEAALRSFNFAFEQSHKEQLLDIAADLIEPVRARDTSIIAMAKKKGLNPNIVVNMLNNHRTYSGFETTLNNNKQPGVIVMDPLVMRERIIAEMYFSTSAVPKNITPISIFEEAEAGMDRLVQCIAKYDSLPDTLAIIGGLYDFYDMTTLNLPPRIVKNNKPYFKPEFMDKVHETMADLVYSAIHGRGYGIDAGLHELFLCPAPSSFPRYEDFHPTYNSQEETNKYIEHLRNWSPHLP